MKQTMLSKFLGTIALSGLAVMGSANAKEQSPTIATGGGLTIKSSDYNFKIHGNLAMDDTLFHGSDLSKGREFISGANLNASISFAGNINKDLSYLFATAVAGDKIAMAGAEVTYSGFSTKNLSLTVGQQDTGYSLENTHSTKWTPLLSRSMHVNAFNPGSGLGIGIKKSGSNYSLHATITQPKHGDNSGITELTNSNSKAADTFSYAGRITVAPLKRNNQVFQLSAASSYSKYDEGSWLRFTVKPEASARNVIAILDTNSGADGKTRTINAANKLILGADVSAQNGPLFAEAEYQAMYIKSNNDKDNLRFTGYHAQVAYVLTGESRTHNMQGGSFGQIKPSSSSNYGAWEVAARYNRINLDSNHVVGGDGNSITTGLSWYANDYVRISANYIKCDQVPGAARFQLNNSHEKYTCNDTRTVNIFGVRGQLTF